MSRYIDADEWRPVVGYEGLYEVSNTGEIRRSNGDVRKLRIKKGANTYYKEVSLWKDGKRKCFLVHRLVAQAFIPNPNNFPIINHKDENGMNNCIENLEWCDHSYNTRYNKYPLKQKSQATKAVSQEQKIKTSISVKKYRREHSKLKFEYNGEMLSIPEISERMNVKSSALWMRYLRTGSIFLGKKK